MQARIRTAWPTDIPFLIELERPCSTAAHWTEQQYRQLFSDDGSLQRLVLVAGFTASARASSDGAETLLGFLVARNTGLEWELENIVVASSARRKGLGRRLLDALLLRAKESGSDAVFLEVRESNLAARTLYQRAGFHETGRRKAYYANPEEDALVFSRKLR